MRHDLETDLQRIGIQERDKAKTFFDRPWDACRVAT